jgi:hypothetical protein
MSHLVSLQRDEMPKSYLMDELKQAGWLKAQALRRQLIAMT